MKLPNNFCILPFLHLATKPGGEARLCCGCFELITKEDNSIYRLDDNIENIWNSKYLRDVRKKFINNEIPTSCSECFIEESNGIKSRRLRELGRLGHNNTDRVKYAIDNNFYCELPIMLDIRMGNLCNLKCRSCYITFSSKIEEENKKYPNGFIKKLNFKMNNKWYKTKQFQKNMEVIIPKLKYIYITGGEPTIITEALIFLKKCVKINKNITLKFNTNLKVFNNNFYNTVVKFNDVLILPSIDATGEKLKYIRHPADWNTIKTNLEKILLLPKHVKININCVLSIYNIVYIDKIFSQIMSVDTHNRIKFTFDRLYSPEYLNHNILTNTLKTKALKAVNKLLNLEILDDYQKSSLNGIKKLLAQQPNDLYKLRKKFIIYTKTLDKIRNENFCETFPELKEMMDEEYIRELNNE